MRNLLPSLFCLLLAGPQEGQPTSPPLADAKDQLAIGLTLVLESGAVQDLRDVRLASLYVPEGTSPSPFLAPGPFHATWEGFISVDLGTRSISSCQRDMVVTKSSMSLSR